MQPQKKKGEIGELQDNLASNKLDQKKAAVRKIIEAMTRGKDVSMLFTDVVKNMATTDMELKKLIYLYIINYAKSHPDLAIMAINTFRKDAKDKVNPFLRALAVRTMGCIRVKQITEYLCDPLKEALKDEDPYVRKTAAICVAKLYDVSPELLEEQGFIKMLENLMNDGNGMVVSNTIAALAQISEAKGFNMISLTPYNVQKLLTALQECTEWGQIYILDALTGYTPSSDGKEVESILERVSPRLAISNPGVVLSAVKLIMKYLDYLGNPESIRNYCRKLNSPLISLCGMEPEIQYVALKNINLIIQKRQLVFDKELKIFFCNFNDPIFIKLEKLEILIKLSSIDNIQQILHELKEYTSEVDVEFVKKAVRAIGRCAIKLEKAAEKCVHVLWECVKSKVQYVVQESIIVIRDIFRKYPNKYEALLKDICESIKSLDDPEAKASFIWIIGEYIETIENSDQLLGNFAEGFKDEPAVVQHQIMTSCIKLFLLRPSEGHELLQKLLKIATVECENPDLRDRAFIYWRLLAIDPELTKKIVFAERPTISDQSYTLDSVILDILIENIGSLSSIYTKRPETFVKKLREVQNIREIEENDEDPEELMGNADKGYQSDMMTSYSTTTPSLGMSQKPMMEQPSYETGVQGAATIMSSVSNPQPQPEAQLNDLLDMDNLIISDKPNLTNQINVNMGNDLLGEDLGMQKRSNSLGQQQIPTAAINVKIPYCNVVSAEQPTSEKKITGIIVEAAFQRENDTMFLYLKISNKTSQLLNDFAVKFNANSFKMQPTNIELEIAPINPGQTNEGRVAVNCNGNNDNNPPVFPFRVQVAMKFNLDIHVFFVPCSLTVLMVPSVGLTTNQYVEETSKPNLARKQDSVSINLTLDEVKDRFVKNNIAFVGSRTNPNGQEMHSYSTKLINDIVITMDIILVNGNLMMQYMCPHASLTPLFYQAVGFVLK